MKAGIRPFHVLITSRSLDFRGGVVNYVRSLLEHADSSLVQFTHIEVAKADVVSSGWRRPFEYLDSILRFGRAVRSARPDVVHLNPSLNPRSLPLHILLLFTAKVLGKPVFQFFHGWDHRVALLMMNRTLVGRLLSWALQRADCSSVLALDFRNQLIQAGWQDDCVQVLPLMIDVAKYQTPVANHAGQNPQNGAFRVLFLSPSTQVS